MDKAAEAGNLEVVKFLHENRTEGCTPAAMKYAMEYGYVDIVKYLHQNMGMAPVSEDVVKAAKNGHFDVVKYVSENMGDVKFSSAVMDAAVTIGSLRLVRYLHTIGTPCCTVKGVFSFILRHGDRNECGSSVPLLEFLLMHCLTQADIVRLYQKKLEIGDKWVLWAKQYLENNRDRLLSTG
ncbi:hypothetical protein HDU76_011127 [Blyttiomyces sp. JEL0837]|nr:hypothetical protein HDU76_011127 [Blyttiomyces sp. JEL0837]